MKDYLAFYLMLIILCTYQTCVIAQGLDTYQEKRVLSGPPGKPETKPDNSSGLDAMQEKRVKTGKPADPSSDGSLEDAEMEQRGLLKKQ